LTGDIAVLAFGGRRPARALDSMQCIQVGDPAAIDAAVRGLSRVIVLGDDAELATVLTRLMRAELLDVEVAPVRGLAGARRALRGPARRVPLIRDDTGTAVVGSALWLPAERSASIHGEGVIDDTVLFDGEVAGVRIEPMATLPGLRAAVLDGRRRRWVSGRAAQLGTTGARVVRDGVAGPREVKRSTLYRHTTGWLRVG
jgi:hypothetical protein